jgi:CRISPR/Cas system-associated endoribonuclease Cas2
MLVLITYDIANLEAGGARRLRNIAKNLSGLWTDGYSSLSFECVVDNANWVTIKESLNSNY